MAEPAQDFDPVESAKRDMSPNLRVVKDGDRHEDFLPSGNDGGGESPASGLRALEGGGESTPRKKGHLSSVTGDSLDDKESSPPDKKEGGLFTGSGNKKKKRWITAKVATTTGGFFGVITGGILLTGLPLAPLQAIHYANILKGPFSLNERHDSNRMQRLVTHSRTKLVKKGGTGSSLKAATRLNLVEVKIAERANAKLAKSGVKYSFDKYGRRSGVSINPKQHPKYKNLSPSEAKIQIAKDLGIKPEKVMGNASGGGNLRANISPERVNIKTARAFFVEQVRLSQSPSASSGAIRSSFGKISSWMQARVLTKYLNLPSAFHPLKKSKVKMSDWTLGKWKNASEKAKAKAKQTKAYQKFKDAQKARAKAIAAKNAKAKAVTEKIKAKSGGFAAKVGAAAMIAGAVCIVYDVSQDIPELNRQVLVMPAISSATNAISAGSQHESGDDIDILSSKAYNDGFTDDKSGTSAFDSPLIRQMQGISGGIQDHNSEIGVVLGALSPESNYTNIVKGLEKVGAQDLCSTFGKVVQSVVGIGLAILGPGGWIVKGVTAGASMAAMSVAINSITNLLSENPIDFTAHMGDLGGSMDAIGSVEMANIVARNSGGTQLSDSDLSVLERSIAKEKSQNTNTFDKLFAYKDPNSVTGKIIISTYTKTPGSQIDGMIARVLSPTSQIPFGNLAKFMGTGGVALADQKEPEYNIKMLNRFGYSEAYDLNEDRLAEEKDSEEIGYIQDVGDQAAQLLEGPESKELVDRAHACFGNTISKNSEGQWQAQIDGDYDPYPASREYGAADCSDGSDDFMTIRKFIDYSQAAEALQCIETGDSEACDNIMGKGDESESKDPSSLTPAPAGKFASPVKDFDDTITNCWRKPGHTGIDLSLSSGTPVLAANNGIVVEAGPGGDAGNYVMIKHDNGLWTNYQHLSSISVSVGDSVTVGDEIGLSGNTGYSTGPHLHFSITDAATLSSRHTGTNTLDPIPYLEETGLKFACE